MLYLEKELLELGRGQQHLGTSPKGLLRVFFSSKPNHF
jgi:hypothetical protein